MEVNVLVTGSSGYIGSSLIKYLDETQFIDKVICYDISDGNDILDEKCLVETLKLNKINVVVHLAALSSVSVCNENPKDAIHVNAIGTRTLLNAMSASGCKHIIYASTSSVYGDSDKFPYYERTFLEPCSPYGATKLLGEHTIYNHYNIKGNEGNYLIFRMFNVVGTSGFLDIDNKISAGYDRLFGALESGNVTIYGTNYCTSDGTCERDYISLRDVCKAYILGIKMMTENKVREVVNICSGSPLSVKQIIIKWNSISLDIYSGRLNPEIFGPIPNVRISYGNRRIGDTTTVYGSKEKALALLGWKPRKKIEDIIRDLAIDKNLSNV